MEGRLWVVVRSAVSEVLMNKWQVSHRRRIWETVQVTNIAIGLITCKRSCTRSAVMTHVGLVQR